MSDPNLDKMTLDELIARHPGIDPREVFGPSVIRFRDELIAAFLRRKLTVGRTTSPGPDGG